MGAGACSEPKATKPVAQRAGPPQVKSPQPKGTYGRWGLFRAEGDKTGRAAGRTTAGEEPPAQRNVWALGLEPRTVGLENRCSIQLSYAHISFGIQRL